MAVALVASSAVAVPSGVVLREIGFKMGNLELPSGMRIVIEEDRSQPLVAIVAVVDVGSAQDPPGKEGLAHLVEHLTFRAKPDGKLQRSSLLDFAGAGYWNGYTNHDLTRFELAGPTEALPQLLALEGARLLNPLAGLDARAFEVEVGVVKNEILLGDEQGRTTAVDDHLFGALYPVGHPYHRPIGGTEQSLSTITLADAQAFVQQYYVPRNITLYVAGDITLATIQKVFDASLPREFLDAPPSGPVAFTKRFSGEAAPVPDPPSKTQLETIHAPAELPVIYIAWSLPSGLGGKGYLERFAQLMFERASIRAATLGSDIVGLTTTLDEGRYGNTLICAVLLKEGKNPERSLERILDKVVKLWEPGATSDAILNSNVDFHWLQNRAIVNVALQTESVRSRALSKATLIHWTGDPLAWGKDMKDVYELTSGRMQSFAYEWLSRGRARAVFVQPNNNVAAAAESLGPPRVFASAEEVKSRVAPEALKTYVHGPTSEIRSFSLKNGLEVYLVQRTNAPTVAVTLGFRGGEATSEPLGAAELVAEVAEPTQDRNGPPARFGARLRLSANEDSTFYVGRAASGNLENLLALLSDSVRTLHVDGGVKAFWNVLVSNQRRYDALPTTKIERTFLEHSFPGSSLGRMATADNFDHLGAGDLQTWIDRSIQPRGAVLAVVGDIDFAGAEKLVRDWFEGWRGDPDARAEAPPVKPSDVSGPVQLLRVDRPGLKQTELRIGCSIPNQSATDYIALRLLGSRLSGRLASLARSSMGGSYGFTGGATLHRQALGLDISGNLDAHALTRVLAVARKELDDMGATKPTEDELGLLKWRQGISSNVRYGTNTALATGLVSVRLAGLQVDSISKYPEVLASVTADDVARVAVACRKTAILVLSGDTEVVTKAIQATAR